VPPRSSMVRIRFSSDAGGRKRGCSSVPQARLRRKGVRLSELTPDGRVLRRSDVVGYGKGGKCGHRVRG
jgi:hypothetical protein